MNAKISIVIPTYKREDSLTMLLQALLPQLTHEYEIIVVEQEISYKRTYERVLDGKCAFTYIFLKSPSTPHAKNVGVKAAKGEYIIFFDDDIRPNAHILSGYKKAFFESDEEIIAGKVLTKGHPNYPNSKNVGKVSFFGTFSDNFTSDIKQEVDTVIGCNAGWKKDVFEHLGGFDESFTGNALREESDLCLRARRKGYIITYEPLLSVEHLRAESGGARKLNRRLWWYYHYFSNETYFFLKHRSFWLVPLILLTRTEWMLRCMFGFGREVSLRSIMTPLRGIIDGIGKYQAYRKSEKDT